MNTCDGINLAGQYVFELDKTSGLTLFEGGLLPVPSSDGISVLPTDGQVYGYTGNRYNWITPVTSWEQLEDKPFGGVIETFEPAIINDDTPYFIDGSKTWYKISDATPAMNDSDTIMYDPNKKGDYAYVHTISHGSTSTSWWDQLYSFVRVCYATTVVGYGGKTYDVPSPGVYIAKDRISWWIKIISITPIDEDYIPNTIARAEDIPEVLGKVGTGSKSVAFNNNASSNASGNYSFAEGSLVTASGLAAHAEGYGTTANSEAAHAEGYNTIATGNYAHAEGLATNASGNASHAQGKYNIIDSESKYVHIVGNGTSGTKLSNAHTLDWSGNAWYAGDVYTGGTGQDDAEAKKLATEDWVKRGSYLTDEVILLEYDSSKTYDETVGNGAYVRIGDYVELETLIGNNMTINEGGTESITMPLSSTYITSSEVDGVTLYTIANVVLFIPNTITVEGLTFFPGVWVIVGNFSLFKISTTFVSKVKSQITQNMWSYLNGSDIASGEDNKFTRSANPDLYDMLEYVVYSVDTDMHYTCGFCPTIAYEKANATALEMFQLNRVNFYSASDHEVTSVVFMSFNGAKLTFKPYSIDGSIQWSYTYIEPSTS